MTKGKFMFKTDFKGEWKYLTGHFNSEGRFVPMGWSKNLEIAKECADLHDQVICELRIVNNGNAV